MNLEIICQKLNKISNYIGYIKQCLLQAQGCSWQCPTMTSKFSRFLHACIIYSLCYFFCGISTPISVLVYPCQYRSLSGGEDDEDVEDETEEDREEVIKRKQEDLEKEKHALLENHSMLEEVSFFLCLLWPKLFLVYQWMLILLWRVVFLVP